MFLACTKCGFLVSVIAGREHTQRCPRCGSGLADDSTADASRDVSSMSDRAAASAVDRDVGMRSGALDADATSADLLVTVDRGSAGARSTNAVVDASAGVAEMHGVGERAPQVDSLDALSGPGVADSVEASSRPASVEPIERADLAERMERTEASSAVQQPEQPDPSDALKPFADSALRVAENASDSADPSNVQAAASNQAATAPGSSAGETPTRTLRTHNDPSHTSTPSPPRFLHGRRSTPLRPRRAWMAPSAVVALALTLALQLLLSQRAELAATARWRPWVATACRAFACTVPDWREPASLVMTGRNVRPDPVRPGVLQVTAAIRNDARWPQPLPIVVLNLSDADGRVLAARATVPQDYAPTPAALIAPGDTIDVAFRVREPASRVDAFDFALR